MLTNKELETISQTILLLNNLDKYGYYDMYQDLKIIPEDIINYKEELHNIYDKYKAQKIKSSAHANAWNKAHPERHNETNKRYNKRKKEVK